MKQWHVRSLFVKNVIWVDMSSITVFKRMEKWEMDGFLAFKEDHDVVMAKRSYIIQCPTREIFKAQGNNCWCYLCANRSANI